ncbi:hypothetical protein TNCV_2970211 [Trichonephila clavipes]|nr:hypothetical protein TNCV_2970211 [Trichonephila clavipes]
MQIAAKEAKDLSGHSDIPVAIDGTWQRHGHTSLNGAVIATSFYTGKVTDAQILSRFCIEKLERVGYVKKWMGAQLRALKLKMKGKYRKILFRHRVGVAFWGFWTVRTVLNPISGQFFDEGHGESGVYIQLSGMTAIGWSMGSGRRGFGASSGWRIWKSF